MTNKLTKFALIVSLLFSYVPSLVMAASPRPPQNLQASITGSNNSDVKLNLEWSGGLGLSYIVTKIFPDGRQNQFPIQSSLSDNPDCIMNGGIFSDPLVKDGNTYTYKVKAIDASMNFSAESAITVTIHLGDSVGCRAWTTAAANISLSNMALNVELNNSSGGAYNIFVDGRLAQKTNRADTVVWPIFGVNHEVKITKSDSASKLIESAAACETLNQEEIINVKKTYTGFFGPFFKKVDALIESFHFL